MSLENITLNGVPLKDALHNLRVRNTKPMTEEEHQRRVVRSARRFSTSSIRNHSGSRSGKCRVIFSAGGGQ